MYIYGSNQYKKWLMSYNREYLYEDMVLHHYGYILEELYINIDNDWIKYVVLFHNQITGEIDLIGFNHCIIKAYDLYTLYNEYSAELHHIETILLERNVVIYPEHDYSINFLIIYLIQFMEEKDSISKHFYEHRILLPDISLPFLTYRLISIENKLNYEEIGWRELFVNHQLYSMNKHDIAKFLHIYDWTYVKSQSMNQEYSTKYYILYISEFYYHRISYKLQEIHVFQLLYTLRVIHTKLQISKLNYDIIQLLHQKEDNGLDVYIVNETGEYGTYIFPYQEYHYTIKILHYEDNLRYIEDDYYSLSKILKINVNIQTIERMFHKYKYKSIINRKIISVKNINNIIPISYKSGLPEDFVVKQMIY